MEDLASLSDAALGDSARLGQSQNLRRNRDNLTVMTMPDERTRALLQAGAFLKELANDQSLPERTRREAARLLRHFPTVTQVRTMALIDQHAALERYLTVDVDPTWLDGYKYGPHG